MVRNSDHRQDSAVGRETGTSDQKPKRRRNATYSNVMAKKPSTLSRLCVDDHRRREPAQLLKELRSKPKRERSKQMCTFLKLVLTAIVILAVAWPLVFWGTAADQAQASSVVYKAPFTLAPQVDFSW
jgi:hypothetical protein